VTSGVVVRESPEQYSTPTSPHAVPNTIPLGQRAIVETGSSNAISPKRLPVPKSHNRIVPSSAPETRRLPSAVVESARQLASAAIFRTQSPLTRSHTHSMWSAPAEITNRLSGVTVMAVRMLPRCSIVSDAPVASSQTRRLAALCETTRPPSGVTAMAQTWSLPGHTCESSVLTHFRVSPLRTEDECAAVPGRSLAGACADHGPAHRRRVLRRPPPRGCPDQPSSVMGTLR
jgi:hypothetical protein